MAILDSDSDHSIIPSLLTYTKHIEMSPTQSDDLWVLHLSMVLIPRMRSLGIHNIPLVRLSLETLVPGLGKNRSMLPRDLPPSLFRCIYALNLSETHFKDGRELLQCLSMLPSATTVNFVSVLCSSPPDYPPWMGRSLSPRLKTVTANQTKPPDNVFATILPAMLAGFQEGLARLELLGLAQLMRSVDVKAQEIDDRGWWTISRNSRSFTLRLFGDTVDARLFEIALYPRPLIHTTTYDDESYDCVLYMPGVQSNGTEAFEFWQEMAERIMPLQTLHQLRLEFDTTERMGTFVKSTLQILRSMHSIGRRISFSARESGSTYTASAVFEQFGSLSRDSEEVEDSQASAIPINVVVEHRT